MPNRDIEYSLLSKTQTLFVVECEEGKEINEEHLDKICSYGTLIYNNGDAIELVEDHYFNQFALKDEEYKYKIKIFGETNIKNVLIDIMTYIGDIDIYINSPNNLQYNKYISINKISITIKIDEYIDNIDNIIITIKGTSNTFYTKYVHLIRDNNIEEDSFIRNKLQTGMSHLVTIDSTKKDESSNANKIIDIMKERNYEHNPIMTYFYALNCKINVVQSYTNNYGYSEIVYAKVFDHLSQDVISSESERINGEELEYRITVIEEDISNYYKGELCQIYVSAIELSEEHGDYSRDIIIPDNIPQQIMFGKNNKHITYGYTLVDFENDLLIKFNLKHKAKYKLKIYYENIQRDKEEIIVGNDIIILKKSEWANICIDQNRLCYIQLDISLDETKNEQNPVLEFSVKSMNSNSVSYITKNILKTDYVKNNDPHYYYTELGDNEKGFVNINFIGGSGKAYAKIVEKEIESENEANWRDKYRLPSNNEEIVFEPFTKKLDFTTKDKNCQTGCYLLMKVFSDIENKDAYIEKYYSFSLIVHAYKEEQNTKIIPVISIPLDEYIIGNILNTNIGESKEELYTVWFSSDAEKIIIDFQSYAGQLFINVGNTKPTVKNIILKLVLI
jgi:hypothetical protein